MEMKLGNIYILFTKNKTIVKRLKVLGVDTYDRVKNTPYNVKILAINERVVDMGASELEIENYFKDKSFYYCQSTETDDKSIYILWDEIIDYDKTTILEVEFEYDLKLTLPSDASYSIASVISRLESFIVSEYKGKITASIVDTGNLTDVSKSEKQVFMERIAEYEKIISNIKSLETILPAVNKLTSFDISGSYTLINTHLKTIQNSLSLISSALR